MKKPHIMLLMEFVPVDRIDWIMTDEKVSVENCFLDKDPVEGKYPSDHFPVICKISL